MSLVTKEAFSKIAEQVDKFGWADFGRMGSVYSLDKMAEFMQANKEEFKEKTLSEIKDEIGNHKYYMATYMFFGFDNHNDFVRRKNTTNNLAHILVKNLTDLVIDTSRIHRSGFIENDIKGAMIQAPLQACCFVLRAAYSRLD